MGHKRIADRIADFILGCIIAAVIIWIIWDILKGEERNEAL